MIGNKITKVSQNNLGTVTYEHDKEMPKEKYRSTEERQKCFDELRLNIIV